MKCLTIEITPRTVQYFVVLGASLSRCMYFIILCSKLCPYPNHLLQVSSFADLYYLYLPSQSRGVCVPYFVAKTS